MAFTRDVLFNLAAFFTDWSIDRCGNIIGYSSKYGKD